jgi:hypothetical protein
VGSPDDGVAALLIQIIHEQRETIEGLTARIEALEA